MKEILILGGTRFIGRNLLEKLIPHQKYNITMFNRGQTNPDLFPNTNTIIGDRRNIEDLKQISTKKWDIVIDISGYWAWHFEQQMQLLQGKIGKYIYISTCSHYKFDEQNPHLIKEEEELVDCTEEESRSDNPMYYNQNKAACERILQQQKNINYIIFRPGLIIGKYDYTDRLYYWLYKVINQPEILISNNGTNVISYTLVSDLVDLIILAIDTDNKNSIYNVPSFIASLKDFIDKTSKLMQKEVQFVSAPTAFLEANNIQQWIDLPLCLNGNYLTIDNSKAKNELHFNFTDIDIAVKYLVDYYSNIRKWDNPSTIPNPISVEREQELIKLLKSA